MRFVYLILICFAAPVVALRAWLKGFGGERRERIADRFGRPALRPSAPVIWIHAASMGEVQASVALVKRLLATFARHEIVMTTMTATGAERVLALFKERVRHCYLPYDLPWAVRGFLDRIKPEQGVILETELWPNLLRACRLRGIPIIVASARISPRTAARYRRLHALFADAFGAATIAAQSAEDAERFKASGAQDVRITGNLKFDLEIPESVRAAGTQWRGQFGRRFVWVAGSTHAGEEITLLDAHEEVRVSVPDALLVLVPRHPQRFEEVRALLTARKIAFAERSKGTTLPEAISVLFVDTMGELLNFYAGADAAFVGGTLVPIGGHSLLEPAALGLPILCGPHVFSMQDIADRFANAGALRSVVSAPDIAISLVEWARKPEERIALGERGRAVIAENRGAADRVLAIALEKMRAL